jgi:hypothetical protein
MIENLGNYDENPDVIFIGGDVAYDNGEIECY